ncbi:hypothetical protein BCR34DRAFT_629167 [Clohesyomyces aquaticus]|uniref:Rhodopsin domain-containing protein n=1 Tax=Clohesyomyces aquaticus TaxID=1231657 RepID=A0A1Y1YAJ4_9PLEO|nr:hypothetical protein BCR34DRAFT_629167 [Clohesyomyces aquaticus]
MASTYAEIVSERQFKRISYPIIVLASSLIVSRVGIQIWKRKRFELQDSLVYFAFIFFLTMSVCYLIIIPKIYKIGKVSVGLIAPWPTIQDDILVYLRLMFVTNTLFWFSLWSVKLSLLCLYKQLLEGLPRVYMRLWWAVFTFCLVSLAGCVISYITSCSDFVAAMKAGVCSDTRSVHGQLASLYTSYAVDVVSDFMIMFLPMKLVWNVQMPRAQKIGVIALFASGVVIIAFATLRVIQVGIRAGKHASPSPTWLALWTINESAVAVCIGCCPALVIMYRTFRQPQTSCDTNGYARHNQSLSGRSRTEAIRMNTVTVGASRSRTSRNGVYWDDMASSQEELAAEAKGIMVTTTLEQSQHAIDKPR